MRRRRPDFKDVELAEVGLDARTVWPVGFSPAEFSDDACDNFPLEWTQETEAARR